MTTWDELDNEEDSKKDEVKVNLTLTALTSYKEESNSDSSSESEEDDTVFSKLSHSDSITFIQDIMG